MKRIFLKFFESMILIAIIGHCLTVLDSRAQDVEHTFLLQKEQVLSPVTTLLTLPELVRAIR